MERLSEITNNLPDLHAAGTTLYIESGPGWAKSSVVENVWPDIITEATGKKTIAIPVHGTTVEALDFRGFPVPVKREGRTPQTVFARSPILEIIERELVEKDAEQCILFFDECGQWDQTVAKAAAPAILDHRMGNEYLPEGTWVVMASNRVKDKAGVSKMLTHLTNRIIKIELEPDVPGLLAYWLKQGLHPAGAGFIQARPGLVFNPETPTDGKPFLSPRSLDASFRYLSLRAGTDADGNPLMQIPDDSFTQSIVAGAIGDGASAELFAYLQTASRLPDIGDILDDPKKAMVPDNSEMDAQYAALALVLHHADADTMPVLWDYIERLRKEFATKAARQFVQKVGPSVLNNPGLSGWLAKNQTLVLSSV